MRNSNVAKIAYAAVLIALLLVLQIITKPAGQIVTGSCVNMILALSAFCLTLKSAIIISIISPFLAFFIGVGPVFFPITPAIAISNMIYVILIYAIDKNIKIKHFNFITKLFIKNENTINKNVFIKNILSIIVASFLKFFSLHLLVIEFICTFFINSLKPAQINTFSIMFSIPQLITALIGGTIACIISKIILNILK